MRSNRFCSILFAGAVPFLVSFIECKRLVCGMLLTLSVVYYEICLARSVYLLLFASIVIDTDMLQICGDLRGYHLY